MVGLLGIRSLKPPWDGTAEGQSPCGTAEGPETPPTIKTHITKPVRPLCWEQAENHKS